MTTDKHRDASADMDEVADSSKQDPPPANEALPDGQFDDQEMPTTDGEPASDENSAAGENSAADAGAESQEEGEAAMETAEEATED